ncbi:hypothetical protein OW763_04410 [Clostridium aestuarii]|uniref:Uncharacterized protein n=1 Tax=Clostridium aestuarii TaxID=338193 RepID=A0ABT4D093_9CLOT|nr:hypothetical protein [Clostridium aestuarii]MCY6483595.1 hypothetical protein [Clostridium aestuarii]
MKNSNKKNDDKCNIDNKDANVHNKNDNKNNNLNSEYLKELITKLNDINDEEDIRDNINEVCDNNIKCVAEKLADINIIRRELTKLRLNPAKITFYENDLVPLLRILEVLGLSSERLSVGASNLNSIPVSKVSKIKKMIELVYDINDQLEGVIEVLEDEIDIFLKIYECDLKKINRRCK